LVKFIRLILKQNSFRMIHAGKSILICFLTFFSISVFAQNWSDNFNDGDYTSGSKIWSGETLLWQVNSNQIQSNGPAATDTLYLSTSSTNALDVEWEFYHRLAFNTSSNNYSNVWLISDSANVSHPNNSGYYVRFGSTNDDLKLYYRNGVNAPVLIIDGTDGVLNTSNNTLKVKINRTNAGLWSVYVDVTGLGSSYQLEGSATDNTLTTSAYFGVEARHTSSNRTFFYFDNFVITSPIPQDNTPPTVLSASVSAANQVDVTFSEAVDLTTSQQTGNYSLTGNTVTSATRISSSVVRVVFQNNLPTSQTLTLQVSGVKDASVNLNTMTPGSVNFIRGSVPTWMDVVINEIIGDPSPVVGLPVVEWIELYNRSATQSYNLKNWSISSRSTGAPTLLTLPDFVLGPDTFVVICTVSGRDSFNTATIQVLNPSGFNSNFLTNGGLTVGLLDSTGVPLDSVSYLNSWYQDGVKAAGGWTIEKINPGDTCADPVNNWIASTDPTGGTPGRENSVYSLNNNSTPLTITSVTITGPSQVTVCFSQKLEITTASNALNFSANHGLAVQQVIPQGPGYTCVVVNFATPIQQDTNYILYVNGIQNCYQSGPFNLNNGFIQYGPGAVPNYLDVVINEIIGDVSPVVGLPAVEFIELHNRTNSTFNLLNWKITSQTGTGTVTTLSLPFFILQPDSFVIVCTTSGKDSFNLATIQAINPSSFSSNFLTTTGKTLNLLDSTLARIDSVTYNPSWYQDNTKDNGGWTIEKINPGDTCSLPYQNWIASNDPSGGTPGRQNSVFNLNTSLTPPAISSATVTGASEVTLCFNQRMDPATLTQLSNYVISPTLSVTQAAPVSPGYTCVVLTLNAPVQLDTLYSLNANSVNNCQQTGPVNLQTNFIQYSPGATPSYMDVVINEIIGDVSPVVGLPQTEFIELYNRTNLTFNLENWKISSQSGTSAPTILTLPSFFLRPDTFVVICTSADKDSFLSAGIQVINPDVFNTNFLTTTGKTLQLLDSVGGILDSVSYLPTWYQDNTKDNGGWTIEKINPGDTCSLPSANWIASNDPSGGTPGRTNSVLNLTPPTTPPAVASVLITGASQVKICFTQKMDGITVNQIGNYAITNGLTVQTATLQAPDYTCVVLDFASPILVDVLYQVTISNVRNCLQAGPFQLNTLFINNSPAKRNEVVVNEIFADPSPIIGLPNAEYVELFNRSPRALDISGWEFDEGSSTNTLLHPLVLLPDSFVILTLQGNESLFTGMGPVMGMSAFSLTNGGELLTLRDTSGRIIDAVAYTDKWYKDAIKDGGGWALERIDRNDTCSTQENWTSSTDLSGGTPGRMNSVDAVVVDITGPKLLSASAVSSDTLIVCFDEPISLAFASQLGSYFVTGGVLAFASATPLEPDYACIQLVLTSPMIPGLLYTLEVSGLEDCSGNPIAVGSQTPFVLNPPLVRGNLVINEILADPTPQVALPGEQFVEVYNRTSNYLDLNGLKLNSDIIGPGIIEPNGYILLIDQSFTDQFDSLGTIAPIEGMNTFTQSAYTLTLKLPNDDVMDEVSYNNTWYRDGTKASGGWSLEKINPNDTCATFSNWTASMAVEGGTPGIQNSVYSILPDTLSPSIQGISVVAPDKIQVCLSEALNTAIAAQETLYVVKELSTGTSVAVNQAVVLSPDFNCIELTLASNLTLAASYTIEFTGLEDCQGNSGNGIDTFVVGDIAQPGDIVINEIFTDVSPAVGLPTFKFLELFNRTNKPLDVTGFSIKRYNIQGDFTSTYAFNNARVILPGGYLVVTPTSGVASYALPGVAVEGAGSLTFNITSDRVALVNADGLVMDRVSYIDDWYQNNVKQDGGWSLERIDPNFFCPNPLNWIASKDSTGGTPGRINSVQDTFTDVQVPKIVSSYIITGDTLILTFNEPIDPTVALDVTHFYLSGGIGNPSQVIFPNELSGDYSILRLLFSTPLVENQLYSLKLAGIKDCPGNTIVDTVNLPIAIPVPPQAGDLLINEILFNPYVDRSDFVEIYNNSPRVIDLNKVYLGEIFTGTDSIFNHDKISAGVQLIFPGDYLCLTASKKDQVDVYRPIPEAKFLEMSSIPSYDDKSGDCILFYGIGISSEVTSSTILTRLDRFTYNESYHYPDLISKEGVSLERMKFDAPTNQSDLWHSAASTVNYATPGYANSQKINLNGNGDVSVSPKTFSPDGDGVDDVLAIQYKFSKSGLNGRIVVFDANGYTVKILKNNFLLDQQEGFITWDGSNDNGQKAPAGIYVVLFEAIDQPSGNKEIYKLPCVLATRLN